jgi:hypothetical protein
MMVGRNARVLAASLLACLDGADGGCVPAVQAQRALGGGADG